MCIRDRELVERGELSPVFFGSALTNFGVETFLVHYLELAPPPLPRKSDQGVIDPMEESEFSAFVFKIQANMNKAHRDRTVSYTHLVPEKDGPQDDFERP